MGVSMSRLVAVLVFAAGIAGCDRNGEMDANKIFAIAPVVVVALLLFALLLHLGAKTCPKCRDRVDRKASVCKSCGHNFQP